MNKLHKAGFINIIGKPNVGKSTLMNALVGEKLSIITSKVQTTRHRILGIVNGDNFQIIFSDTPGIIKPRYELQSLMMKSISSAFDDADIIIFIVSASDAEPIDPELLKKLIKLKLPIVLLINKIDLSNQKNIETFVEMWKSLIPNVIIYPISALNGFNVKNVFKRLLTLLPFSPAYFPKDQLTDRPERFFVNEKIREKILIYYSKEIPYAVEVITDEFIEEEKIIKINSTIMVERESQKGILIGHKGKALKRVGVKSRIDLERFFRKKIYLKLNVKLNKNWRSNKNELKRFGYQK
ncbi:MAG: GTPase Era [Flavobacteriaceae bacterium]|nr:GTPase Era [Flavobacteriaceae bacterium]|tara:strand:- start:102 stop:989 length:888 start_codon:yes stop_codon:yes gene_type:complete